MTDKKAFWTTLIKVMMLIWMVIVVVSSKPGYQIPIIKYVSAGNQATEWVFTTESKFSSEFIYKQQPIKYDTETRLGTEKNTCDNPETVQAGVNGTKTDKIEISYYQGEIIDSQVVETIIKEPVTEIIIKGLKKNYQTMSTDSGIISYWCKLGKFTATAYDASCAGCSQTTATGMKAGFGVVAVDPNVIPLGSQLYITGYGKAVAGDTGGKVKGKRIDLGFDKIGKWWGVREVEVYLM